MLEPTKQQDVFWSFSVVAMCSWAFAIQSGKLSLFWSRSDSVDITGVEDMLQHSTLRKAVINMRMANQKGEEVYYNPVFKNGKNQWIIKGIGSTVVLGRDRQKRKSRTFTQEAQAEAYLKRHGFRAV